MSVEELGALHRRYVDLSDRFRSAWSFHKFLGSLYKVLMKEAEGPRALDFQSVYGELKEVSLHLNASGLELVKGKLNKVEAQLAELNEGLLAEDSRIAPSAVRKFFRRVKNPDEKVLTQLTKFYLCTYPAAWNHDRLDKFDFLLTHLASESDLGGGGTTGSREQFRELLVGLHQLADTAPDGDDAESRIAEYRAEIEDFANEIRGVEDLDELHERRIVRRYREVKRRLGPLLFEPRLLLKIVTTNLALGERVDELYQREERAIAAACREVFSLEQEAPLASQADASIDADLNRFRREFERFEKELQGGELKLDRLAQIRFQARSLTPRLRSSLGEGGERDAETSELSEEIEPSFAIKTRNSIAHLIGYADSSENDGLRRILEVLSGVNLEADPAEIAVQPDVFALRLEGREVEAYRRLNSEDPKVDLSVERFLLESAGLRVQLNESAEEIRGILDDTAATGEGPVFELARGLAVRADSFLRHFGHLIEHAVLERREEHARSLQIVRMRLMRDYSGLWLLAFRPSRWVTRPDLG